MRRINMKQQFLCLRVNEASFTPHRKINNSALNLINCGLISLFYPLPCSTNERNFSFEFHSPKWLLMVMEPGMMLGPKGFQMSIFVYKFTRNGCGRREPSNGSIKINSP